MDESAGDGSVPDERDGSNAGDTETATAGFRVTECERCPALVESRSQIVNGVGPTEADVLFVGEGPGEVEDREGQPFVGRSGDLLTEKLAEVGLDRETVRITNSVKCRPPDNRDPTREELGNCRGYLEAEVAAVDPAVVVALGKVPAEHLLGHSVAVTSEAGSVETVELGGAERRVLVCVHPAAMLYDRSQEATLERTLAAAANLAGVEPGDGPQRRLGEF